MDNQDQPKNPFEGFRSRLNLYSYVCQLVFVFLDLLMCGVSLILAHEDGLNLVYLWISLGGAVVSLVLLAVLSALYFAGTPEERNTRGRIRACLVIRMSLRIIGLVIMTGFLLHLGLVSPNETGWSHFLYIYSILGLIVSGLSTIYAIWKLAWMKENPDRYDASIFSLHSPHEVAKKDVPEKDFSKDKTARKKDSKKKEIVEVDVRDKK